MVQEWFEEHNNEFEVMTWPPNPPHLNPIEHLWDVVSPIHGGPTLQLTGLKGSAANILVPDTTAHLQGSSGVHASTGQGCFGSKRGTNNIRQVIVMLCLIGVYNFFHSTKLHHQHLTGAAGLSLASLVSLVS